MGSPTSPRTRIVLFAAFLGLIAGAATYGFHVRSTAELAGALHHHHALTQSRSLAFNMAYGLQTRVLDNATYIKDYLRVWDNVAEDDGVVAIAVFDTAGTLVHGVGPGHTDLSAGSLQSGQTLTEEGSYTLVRTGVLNDNADPGSRVIGMVVQKFSRNPDQAMLAGSSSTAALFSLAIPVIFVLAAFLLAGPVGRRSDAA